MPSVPARVEDRLVHAVRDGLNELRSLGRYNERDRVMTYAGLVSMRVLGIKSPKTKAGRSYFEEYDHLMQEHGRKMEFGP